MDREINEAVQKGEESVFERNADSSAVVLFRYFRALTAAGFSEAQAFELVKQVHAQFWGPRLGVKPPNQQEP